MLSLNSLGIGKLQDFKAVLTEYINEGNDSVDGLLFETERLIQLQSKRVNMSAEAIVRAKAKKQKKLGKKKQPVEEVIYRNVCPSCNKGEAVVVTREGVTYETCGRIIDGRLQLGCGYSKLVVK